MGGEQSKEPTDALITKKDSDEYKFCDKLLSTFSEVDQKAHQKLFEESKATLINWTFWTGEESFYSAYRKTIAILDDLSYYDVEDLVAIANKIVQNRKSRLDDHTGESRDEFMMVHNRWRVIEEKLTEKLRRKQKQQEDAVLSFFTLIVMVTAAWSIYWLIKGG